MEYVAGPRAWVECGACGMWQGQQHGWSVAPGVGYAAGPIKMGGLWYMRHVAGPMAWVECGAWGVYVAGPIQMGGLWCLVQRPRPMQWVECGAWGMWQGE